MSLFQLGDFTLHSGSKAWFKIDCDALTDTDWACLAQIVHDRFQFGKVIGIPNGGTKLAQALEQFIETGHRRTLLVDDVLTTGASFETMADQLRDSGSREWLQGVVIFARDVCPYWVRPIFQMTSR